LMRGRVYPAPGPRHGSGSPPPSAGWRGCASPCRRREAGLLAVQRLADDAGEEPEAALLGLPGRATIDEAGCRRLRGCPCGCSRRAAARITSARRRRSAASDGIVGDGVREGAPNTAIEE
jgi:hypothetical protein